MSQLTILVILLQSRNMLAIYREQNIYKTINECRQSKILNQAREQRLIEATKEKVRVSQQRFVISNNNNYMVFRKRRKVAKYTFAQLERIPRCCRALKIINFVDTLIV